MPRLKSPRKNEAGFSLVEVVVASAIGGVVAIGILTVFVNVFNVSDTVNIRAAATNNGQVVSSSLISTLRNSDTVTVTPLADGQQVVRARTATGLDTNDWVCTTWVFGVDSDRGTNAVYQRTSSDKAIIPAGTDTAWAGWGMLADNIKPNLADGSFVNALNTTPVAFGFTVDAGKGKPLVLSNSAIVGAIGSSDLDCG